MFISVECNVIKFLYSLLRGSDLTHIPEAQWPTLIMKNKLTHALRSLPVGSIPMRKGTTLLSNEGYFHLQLPNSGPTQGCQNVTSCKPSASACTLWDLGELRSLTKRDSSFPRSTPGAVPSVPMHIQESISSSQPVYGQAGDYEKHKRQYLTHDV